MEEQESQKRAKNIKTWIKNPYNLILILILIFAFGIRLYHHNLTQGQTLWWDESEYMSAAKHWAFDIPYDLNPQRPPLFQFLASILFRIGFTENLIKFTLTLLPSLFLVYVIYLLGKEMFNKKIGLIAAFLASFNWSFLFWTARVQPDFISMCFQVLAVLFMWRFWKISKTKPIILSGIFAALGFYFKISALLVPLSFLVFILIKDRLSALKNKNYYLFALAFILTLVPFMIWSYLQFGNPIAIFASGYSDQVVSSVPFGWYNLKFFYSLTNSILFFLFILGVIIALKFLLYLDILLKEKKKTFDPNLFSILVLIIVSAFYIFYIRGTEDRWVFLWLPFIFLLIGNALMFIYAISKKYFRSIASIIVIVLLLFGAYSHISQAKSLIDSKKESYLPIKQAGIWIKENSNKNDVIFSASLPQMTYYSERKTISFSDVEDKEDFDIFLEEHNPRYLQVSVFENRSPWMADWLNENQERLNPVQALFADAEKQNAILVVYEVEYA